MFHHLRHTAGQQMAELGYGIEEAQAFLGHESPETTQIYYEVTNRRLRDVSRRFRYGRRRDRP
jgi:integrase/recombinase XerD